MIDIKREILNETSASRIIASESVQSLWSGYGEIVRYCLEGGDDSSIIVKHIKLPDVQDHPRGWNTHTSHQRKLKSYQVETCWYRDYAHLTTDACLVPKVLKVMNCPTEILIIMEDLDASGLEVRLHPDTVAIPDVKRCLTWLAQFHARFMLNPAIGLWPIGTYWHLETRPDEYQQMENLPLKQAAKAIDQQLNDASYQTIVHGDAKLANFCFSREGKVAAVDFQYVGRGCGIKDVAYFLGSCFDDEQCESQLLTYYFKVLQEALHKSIDFQSLKEEWMDLYKYAWADFYRFLDGWSPGHWKMHGYSEKLTDQVIKELDLR